MATIGFVGLGNMGIRMARNLVEKGHRVQAFDLNAEALRGAKEFGAAASAQLADVTKGAEFIITMLPTGKESRAVWLSEEGLLKSARAGAVLMDCSTVDVDTARELGKSAKTIGLEMLDAPVSGGTIGAENATLTFMCGGDRATFDKAHLILSAMGKRLVYVGGPGHGQAAKICNNMLAGINTIASAEAMVLGRNLGLDPAILFDVIANSSGSNQALLLACPIPGVVPAAAVNKEFKPGFTGSLMLKDLRLSQLAAQASNTPTTLGAVAAQLFTVLEAVGLGQLDCSAIVKLVTGEIGGSKETKR
ncbi:3-hydroxyisobutyrate dehydrogenase [Bradyrhizobium vignae]|uniref:3-hydroxyisobutyrate dehydrogenase n=1 Tax=Bradyrhizobium vignae TaxID=1549949 RepID=UPI00100B8CF8|nr:3-hydroxyisobutyrate dehydrogenase [Bradyrhizobium vignae]RXH06687.1 3-hydroxyisobutyrate dehydrogenase [Bradyrhizobium vignae]